MLLENQLSPPTYKFEDDLVGPTPQLSMVNPTAMCRTGEKCTTKGGLSRRRVGYQGGLSGRTQGVGHPMWRLET